MVQTVKYRYKLSKLRAKKHRLGIAYSARIREADGKPGGREATRDLRAEWAHEQGLLDDEIDILVTGHLLWLADRLFVSVPPYEDQNMWAQTTSFDQIVTPLGMATVRTPVRAELEKRREWVLKLLAVLIGLIGAATGFIAVWLKVKGH